MAKIKAIIFDLNGIFINSQPLSERVAEQFGVDKEIFWDKFKESLKIARTPAERTPYLWQPVADYLNISVSEFLKFWFSGETINYDMLNLVGELKNEGYLVLILSNNLKERTEYYRQNFSQLFDQFNGTYFSWETGFVKPDPKAFENVLKINHLNASDCIYFDDTPSNVQAAINLGIHARVFEDARSTKEFITQFITNY